MKRLTGDSDYLCISGKTSDITSTLNKIAALYDLSVLSSAVKENGIVVVIVERRQKKESGTSPLRETNLPGVG